MGFSAIFFPTGGMKVYDYQRMVWKNSELLASEYPCLIVTYLSITIFYDDWVFNLCGFDPEPNHAISFFQVPGRVRMGSSTAKVGLTWAEGSTQCNFLNIQVWSDGCVSLRASLEENHGASAMTGPKKLELMYTVCLMLPCVIRYSVSCHWNMYFFSFSLFFLDESGSIAGFDHDW